MPVLARRVGKSLVDAGFSLHRCIPRDPLGGVCLTPVPGSQGEDPAAICASASLSPGWFSIGCWPIVLPDVITAAGP
jgi:hypothetical protein